MKPYHVLVDACDFLPHVSTDLLLSLAEAGVLRISTSALILHEVERNLVRKLGLTPAKAAYRVTEMRKFLDEGMTEGFEARIPFMTNHPGDRHILAAAVESRANWIVTENIKHYPPDALSQHGITAIKLSDLLWSLYVDQPEIVKAVMADRAKRLFNISIPLLLERFCKLAILKSFAERVQNDEKLAQSTRSD